MKITQVIAPPHPQSIANSSTVKGRAFRPLPPSVITNCWQVVLSTFFFLWPSPVKYNCGLLTAIVIWGLGDSSFQLLTPSSVSYLPAASFPMLSKPQRWAMSHLGLESELSHIPSILCNHLSLNLPLFPENFLQRDSSLSIAENAFCLQAYAQIFRKKLGIMLIYLNNNNKFYTQAFLTSPGLGCWQFFACLLLFSFPFMGLPETCGMAMKSTQREAGYVNNN